MKYQRARTNLLRPALSRWGILFAIKLPQRNDIPTTRPKKTAMSSYDLRVHPSTFFFPFTVVVVYLPLPEIAAVKFISYL